VNKCALKAPASRKYVNMCWLAGRFRRRYGDKCGSVRGAGQSRQPTLTLTIPFGFATARLYEAANARASAWVRK
jgi:hypothetical protein